MCPRKRNQNLLAAYKSLFPGLKSPQLELPLGDINPSDLSPVVTYQEGEPVLELLEWGWLKPGSKKRIINIQAERRRDPPGVRGLTLVDAFYEFKGEKYPKSMFEVSPIVNEPLAYGMFKRANTYSLGTVGAGPDIASIKDRQPLIIRQSGWDRWLSDPDWPRELIEPLPAGSLRVQQVR